MVFHLFFPKMTEMPLLFFIERSHLRHCKMKPWNIFEKKKKILNRKMFVLFTISTEIHFDYLEMESIFVISSTDKCNLSYIYFFQSKTKNIFSPYPVFTFLVFLEIFEENLTAFSQFCKVTDWNINNFLFIVKFTEKSIYDAKLRVNIENFKFCCNFYM